MKTKKRRAVSGTLSLIVGAFVASFLMMPKTSDAIIHEIVAAYCSGGGVGVIDEDGELFPPGIGGGSNADNFAQPVIASGAVDVGTLTITDKPNTKFPEGTSVFAATPSASNHPSAAHCPNAADLP